jgi:hypothetical protein
MTLALTIKVNDGIVLAADSATTFYQNGPQGQVVINVYENANKVFHLHKALPICIITWGGGSIGQSSIGTLIKDFRFLIMNDANLKVDVKNYSIEQIAMMFHEFIEKEYKNVYGNNQNIPYTGFKIAGYSANEKFSEEWLIEVINGIVNKPVLARDKSSSGASWYGQVEPMVRLIKGYSMNIFELMKQVGIEHDKIEQFRILAENTLDASLVQPAMPIKDAIDLAEFFIDTTAKFIKYSPGAAQSVGGPIEIAAITKHEGFKWVQRKFYFDEKFNPKE